MTPKDTFLQPEEIPGATAEVLITKILQIITQKSQRSAEAQGNGMDLQETTLSAHIQNPQKEKKVNPKVLSDPKKNLPTIKFAPNSQGKREKNTNFYCPKWILPQKSKQLFNFPTSYKSSLQF